MGPEAGCTLVFRGCLIHLTQPLKYVLTLKEMLCHLVTEEPAWAFPYMARELPMLEGIP